MAKGNDVNGQMLLDDDEDDEVLDAADEMEAKKIDPWEEQKKAFIASIPAQLGPGMATLSLLPQKRVTCSEHWSSNPLLEALHQHQHYLLLLLLLWIPETMVCHLPNCVGRLQHSALHFLYIHPKDCVEAMEHLSHNAPKAVLTVTGSWSSAFSALCKT